MRSALATFATFTARVEPRAAPVDPPCLTMRMSDPRIRPKVVCVFRRGDEVLVGSHYDRVKDETFYGPPGGGIEFGEYAEEALRREMREELDAELGAITFLRVIENVFTHQGRPKHEIAFIFTARFVDESFYAQDEIMDDEGGEPYPVTWMPLAHFALGGPPLYPTGLYDLLAQRTPLRDLNP